MWPCNVSSFYSSGSCRRATRFQVKPFSLCFWAIAAANASNALKASSEGTPLHRTGSMTSTFPPGHRSKSRPSVGCLRAWIRAASWFCGLTASSATDHESVQFCEWCIVNQCRALSTVKQSDLEYFLEHPPDAELLTRLADHIADFSLAGIKAVSPCK